MPLFATLRALMLPVGLLLVTKGVEHEQTAAEQARAQLAETETELGMRRVKLAKLDAGAPAADVPDHAAGCSALAGYRCDFIGDVPPEPSCAWPARAHRHAIGCPYRYGQPCTDPRGECAELAEFFAPLDDPPAEEAPAPGPHREEFPTDPVGEVPFGTMFAVGVFVAAVATVHVLNRRQNARRATRRLPTDAERRAARVPVPVDEERRAAWLRGDDLRKPAPAGEDQEDAGAETARAFLDGQHDNTFACPWGCGWFPAAGAHPDDKRVRRALHGNTCAQRPAAMAVSG